MSGKEVLGGPQLDAPPGLPLDAQLAELAARQHGVVSAAQLRRIGMTGSATAKRVDAGLMHKVHRGVYAVGHVKLSDKGRYMAAVLAAGDGAVLASLSAAVLWKAWRRRVSGIHVLAPDAPQTAARAPRARDAPPRSPRRHRPRRHPVTTVARTLVDLTDVLSAHQLANVIHEAAFHDRFDATATRAALERANGRRSLSRLRAALQADGAGTRSDLEDRFLALVAGLAPPAVNTRVAGFEVDFAWPGLVVEIDGPGHARPRTRREDAHRDASLKRAGYSVLRVTGRDL